MMEQRGLLGVAAQAVLCAVAQVHGPPTHQFHASREGALEGGVAFPNYNKGIGSLRKFQATGVTREQTKLV